MSQSLLQQLITDDSEFIYQLFGGSIQSSPLTTTSLNTGKVLQDNKALKMYFLYSNALPLLSNQAGKEQSASFGWGQSKTVPASENFIKLYFL